MSPTGWKRACVAIIRLVALESRPDCSHPPPALLFYAGAAKGLHVMGVHGRIDMGHNVAVRRAPTISHGSKITGTSLGRVSAA